MMSDTSSCVSFSFRCSVPGFREVRGAIQHRARCRFCLSQSVRSHHAHAGKQCQHLHKGLKNLLMFLNPNHFIIRQRKIPKAFKKNGNP